MSDLWNKKTKALVKVLLSALLLFWLFRAVNPSNLLDAVSNAKVTLLILALLCQVTSNLVAGLRWRLAMGILDMGEPTAFFVKSFFKGTFFSQVLPGSIGGDGVRMLDLKGRGYNLSDSVDGVIVDRAIGLLALLFLCLSATFLESYKLPSEILRGVRIICISGIAGFGFLALLSRLLTLEKIKYISFLARIAAKICRVFYADRKTVVILFFSLVVHIFAVCCIYLLSTATGQHIGFITFLVTIPSVILLTVVPISFAGWGVREGAMVALFMSMGVPKEPILCISILYGLVVMFASLPGLFFWLRR